MTMTHLSSQSRSVPSLCGSVTSNMVHEFETGQLQFFGHGSVRDWHNELEPESPLYTRLPCNFVSVSNPGLYPEDPIPTPDPQDLYSTVIPLHKRSRSLRTKSSIFESKLRTLNRNLKRRLTFSYGSSRDKPLSAFNNTKSRLGALQIDPKGQTSTHQVYPRIGTVKMSLNGEENELIVNESFWEIGNYKRTCKRIDDGLKLCHDFTQMIKERGDIEAKYAEELRQWAKKWGKYIEKGPEYGTCERALTGVLEEAEGVADIHTRVKDRLVEEVASTVKVWHKENFHPKALGGIKESKEVDDAFRKAQKHWAKLYVKVEKCKRDFHAACKQEKSAINQDKNAQGDNSISVDQQKKLSEKVDKCREDKEKSKDSYDKTLHEINACNAKYMEDMTMVFEKCQEMELKRLKFFKEMLFGVHKCLDLTKENKLPCIYNGYWERIQSCDPEQDLTWWSHNHGTAMPMNWPTFEDYVEEFHSIAAPSNMKVKGHVASNTIQLKGVYAQKFHEEFVEYSPELRNITKKTPSREPVALIGQRSTFSPPVVPSVSAPKSNNNFAKSNGSTAPSVSSNGDSCSPVVRPSSATESSASPVPQNVPADDEWDLGEPGVCVRALYDYISQEDDELTFQKGDEFDKLEDEDEQGWCKGRKDGVIGLYPANYAINI